MGIRRSTTPPLGSVIFKVSCFNLARHAKLLTSIPLQKGAMLVACAFSVIYLHERVVRVYRATLSWWFGLVLGFPAF